MTATRNPLPPRVPLPPHPFITCLCWWKAPSPSWPSEQRVSGLLGHKAHGDSQHPGTGRCCLLSWVCVFKVTFYWNTTASCFHCGSCTTQGLVQMKPGRAIASHVSHNAGPTDGTEVTKAGWLCTNPSTHLSQHRQTHENPPAHSDLGAPGT